MQYEHSRYDYLHGDEDYKELGPYECDCGENGRDKLYRQSLSTCATKDCLSRVCKYCAGRCRLCLRPFCPSHTQECLNDRGFCEDCDCDCDIQLLNDALAALDQLGSSATKNKNDIERWAVKALAELYDLADAEGYDTLARPGDPAYIFERPKED